MDVGGAVYVSGIMNIHDGALITNCQANWGGAIYVTGTLNMDGGTMSGNKAVISDGWVASGGAVEVKCGGTFNLSGRIMLPRTTAAASSFSAKAQQMSLAEQSTATLPMERAVMVSTIPTSPAVASMSTAVIQAAGMMVF